MISIDARAYLKSLGITNESVITGVTRFFREAKQVEGKTVHKRLNLYIDMGSACTGNCDFCIAKVKDKSHRAKNFSMQLNALKKAVKLCYSIEMLGGEPLLYADEIRQMLPFFGGKKTVFVTNATRHLFLKNIDLLNQFDHLDISRHELDDQKNQEIFKTKVDLLTKTDIGNLPENLKRKTRFNITCFRGGVDSSEKAIKFIDEFSRLGVKEFMFGNLTKLPSGFYETSVENFTKENRLPDSVFNQLEKDLIKTGYVVIKRIDGLGYKVRILEKNGIKVVLKENDDTNNHILIKDMFEKLGLVADMVMTPNGEVYSDWYYSNRIY